MNTMPYLLAMMLTMPSVAIAQTTLAPPGERISDAAIQRDHASYESTQARIQELNDAGHRGGHRVAGYHLAKAQCWLEAGFHEYTRNDRGGFAQAALKESEKLVTALEARAEPLPSETLLVNGAAKLRPDLWERVHVLKQSAGFGCAAQRTACAEVELVHAGNELAQGGWRHAKPYVLLAEDGVAEAESLARSCVPATRKALTALP